MHDPKPEAELVIVRRGLEPAVAQARDLGSDPLDTYLGVLASERARPLQSSITDCLKWECQEFGVELYGRHK